jgi:hypothetical protein
MHNKSANDEDDALRRMRIRIRIRIRIGVGCFLGHIEFEC